MTTSYISCACNRIPHSVDWGNNGLVCFATCHAIAIYDPCVAKIGRVRETLHKHTGRVNAVQWIKRKKKAAEFELLSISVDGTAIIWSQSNKSFKCTSVITVGEILTISTAMYISENNSDNSDNPPELLICTGTINGNMHLWLRTKHGVKCEQNLTFGGKLPIEICFSYLPQSQVPILAIGMENSSIELYVPNALITSNLNFIKVQVLTGHEDWVRCMDFCFDNDNSILLASGSQDSMIRLWRISVETNICLNEELQLKKQVFIVENVHYNITLESVLCGHEGWVYGIHWHSLQDTDKKKKSMKLLSCSIDKSMIIWEPNDTTGVWSEKVRVGEVGGNSLGFYGCKFNGNGLEILAHGYQGSFHIWKYSESVNNWIPQSVPSGHFAEVVDLCWDPKGRFLITASADQTTRIHAPWVCNTTELWHEIGRPQVHGYDLVCLCMFTPYKFASGAEEKVVRIFMAPTIFKNHLMKIANVDDFKDTLADNASVPALGLTNKAVYNEETKNEESETEINNISYIPPTEEELMQNTLWPELQKLYGHGYEIFSIATTNDGTLLATACKSTSLEHAAILIWDTVTWLQLHKLVSHQLTVTQMEFSPNNKYLVSVSRDRRWSLFKYTNETYELIATSLKKNSFHSRIIWCCSWTYDSQYFATGSRDGKIGIWNSNLQEKDVVPTTNLDQKNQSITALCFSQKIDIQSSYILAIGYETGYIEIQKIQLIDNNFIWKKYITFDSTKSHHLTVKRLKFRPYNRQYSNNILQLASCGLDHAVKIYDLNILELQNY